MGIFFYLIFFFSNEGSLWGLFNKRKIDSDGAVCCDSCEVTDSFACNGDLILPEKAELRNNDPPGESNSSILGEESAKKEKLGTPLLPFSRTYKRKRHLNGSNVSDESLRLQERIFPKGFSAELATGSRLARDGNHVVLQNLDDVCSLLSFSPLPFFPVCASACMHACTLVHVCTCLSLPTHVYTLISKVA